MEQRRVNRRRPAARSSHAGNAKKIFLVIMLVLAILAVGVGILAFSDIAGDKVLEIAAGAVKEQTGLLLSAEGVGGNPVWGYTLNGVSLDRDEGQKRNIFAANTLGVKINFMSLLSGSPRLSLLEIGGVNLDVEKFIADISAVKFPESSGGGEIPIDRISLEDSRFTSKWGAVDVNSIGADIRGTSITADVDAAVNGVPVNGSADGDLNGKDVLVRKLDLQVGKGRLTTAGNAGIGEDGAVTVDFQGALKGMDMSDVAAFWPSLSTQDYAGAADVDFTAEGAGSNLLITANLGFKGSKLGGLPLESLTSRLRYANMRVSAESVKATILGIPIEGEFAMAMRPGAVPSIMVKLDGSGVPLSEIAKLYPNLGSVSGRIERFAVDIHGPTDALSGVVELSAPDMVLVGKQVKNLAAQVKLVQGNSAAVNGKFVFEGAQGYLQGNIANIRTPGSAGLNLTANLLGLDVKKIEDLIPDGQKHGLSGLLTADLTVKGTPSAPVIGGTLTSPQFSAVGYTLDKPSLSFTYDKDTLTLKESTGSWSGLPIKVSGTVGPLSSKTPDVAMTAQLSFSPETLKRFVPDVDKYQLKGTINAGVKVTGKLPQPGINLVASSQALSALGQVSAKNLEVTTSLGGDLSKLDKVDLVLKTGSIAAGGVGLQNVSATIRKDGPQVRLENASAKSGEGSVAGGGTVTLSGTPALNLAFDLNQLDLAPLAQSGGLGIKLSGQLSGHLEVKGPSSNPEISFKGQAPSAAVEGFTLTGLTADVSGNAQAVKINDFKGNVGGAPLSATGSVSFSDPFRADINVMGSGLDLASLTSGIPDLKGQVSGKADLQFNLKSAANGSSGSGSVTSPAVTAFGLKVSNVSIPLAFTGANNTLKSEGGTLNLYGGKLTNTLTFDINTMKFTDEINASGVDVNALAQDATGGLGGNITGTGALSSFKITGSAGETVTYSGSGQFTMGEGSITGFTGLDVLSALYGVSGIRYTKVTAPLRLETGKLHIVKGASATPPANDPIYRGAELVEDGTVTFDKKIYFVADANVNFQLINVLAGGVVGGAGALIGGGQNLQNMFSGGNLESALRGAITGGREQGREADFRDVTAKVTGTVAAPSISIIKVGPQASQQGAAPAQPAAVPAVPSAPAKPEDIIKEQILDAIIPQRPGQAAPVQPAPAEPAPAQPAPEAPPAQPQPEPEPVEKQIERRVEEEIIKGLGGLFK